MRKRSVAASAALLISVGSLAPTAAHAAAATTIYVNRANGANCSDSGAGTQANPYCTIQAAVDAATAGQTVLVEPGGYGAVTISNSGTSAAPISVVSAVAQQASVAGTSTNDAAPSFTISGASYVNVSGFMIASDGGAAALVEGSTSITLNGLYDVAGNTSSTPVIDITGTSSHVTISRSHLEASGGNVAEVQVDSGSSDDTITTNVIGGYSAGVLVDGAVGTEVTSNTIDDVCTQGIALSGASTDSTIEDNIVTDVETKPINSSCPTSSATPSAIEVDAAATSGTTLDYNIDSPTFAPPVDYIWAGTSYQSAADLESATGQGAHDLNVDPQVDPGPSADSPAINSANSSAPGELSTDVLGDARVDDPNVPNTGAGTYSYYDRGAIQYEDPLTPGLSLNTQTGTAPATITLNESLATAGWAPVTAWDVNWGDGFAPTSTPTAQSVSHTYTASGHYTVTLTAVDGYGADGRGSTSVTEQEWMLSNSVFHPVPLTRILDTRTGTGTGGVTGPVKADSAVPLQIDGVASMPATGIAAVALNITVAGPTRNGVISAYADGTARPNTSNMNYSAGENLATQVIAPVGADGKVDLYNNEIGGSTDLIADVVGYYGAGAGLGLETLGVPTRLLDTRNGTGTGGVKTPVPAGGTLKLTSADTDGWVGAGATFVFNVTVTNAKSNGYLTVYPDGANRPSTSNINFRTGQTLANQIFVQAGNDGSIDFYNDGTGTVDVIADLLGMFTTNLGAGYTPITPVRVLDTRVGTGAPKGAVGPQRTVQATMDGVDGLPANLQTVAATVTVVSPTASGDIQAYPDYLSTPPGVSTLNFPAGATAANSTTMSTESTGIKLLNQSSGSSQILVDVFGYYQ